MALPTYSRKLTSKGIVRDGLLFIPDISGFTSLVHGFDVLTGKQITCELLSAVLSSNLLHLSVSEIEGDAILFYRYGAAPTLAELMRQYDEMVLSFESRRAMLEKKLSKPLNLSLKIIAHYGPMAAYRIGHFKKLYGEVVVEAHRLLKNSIKSNSYLLLTDSLLIQASQLGMDAQPGHRLTPSQLCETDSEGTKICYTYYDMARQNELQQVA